MTPHPGQGPGISPVPPVWACILGGEQELGFGEVLQDREAASR